jgi:hypothetical protein
MNSNLPAENIFSELRQRNARQLRSDTLRSIFGTAARKSNEALFNFAKHFQAEEDRPGAAR